MRIATISPNRQPLHLLDDIDHMRHALRLGRRTLGATGKNPAVGCVIVKDGRVLATGWTGEGGIPHAEARALEQAGAAARGATAYVSLEPCCHHGRTGPCADALIAAGIVRVVTAVEDPDPRVEGRGHARLRNAGVMVETGLLAEESRRDLAGFLSRIARQRPHVLLKLALSADGMIASAPGLRTAITGEQARARTHLMRAHADAIMVGVNTVKTDDPVLTCRLPGLEHRSPLPVIVDGSLSTPLASRLVAAAGSRPLIILTADEAQGGDELARAGAELVRCPEAGCGRIDLGCGLTELGRRGINRLLVEGGANLASQLIGDGLVDALALFVAPMPLGAQGVKADLDLNAFRKTAEETLGQDVLTLYDRR
jgi:diaminohydroxyphosphoribosylaminopyrimidine deaminase / 5-amino-6-(5-phosphoribosylamino)uracil reductase